MKILNRTSESSVSDDNGNILFKLEVKLNPIIIIVGYIGLIIICFIILKPSKLTKEEFPEIKQHTIYGEKIIGNSKYLKMSAEIVRNHHEKYDGIGHPDAKVGDEIPLSARIVFLAYIYDALRSERPYKPVFSHEGAYEIITKEDGRVNQEHFDPKILEVFKKIHLDFSKIFEELID